MTNYQYRSVFNVFCFFAIVFNQASAQKVFLSANGPGKTYEEINNALAPGRDVVEVPDCVHTEFGRHIEEVFDAKIVFFVDISFTDLKIFFLISVSSVAASIIKSHL